MGDIGDFEKNSDRELDSVEELEQTAPEIVVPTGFKKSFMGGFRKKDVLEFINSLIAENNKIQENLQSSLETQLSNCADLSTKLDSLQTESDSTKSELNNTSKSLKDALENVSALQTNLTSKNNELNMKTKLIAEQSHRLELKVAEFNTATKENIKLKERVDELQLKEQKLDKLRSEIGQLFVEAKSNASDIVKKAKDENVEVKKQTNDIAATVTRELTSVKGSLNLLKKQLHDTMNTMERQIDILDSTVDNATARIEKYTSQNFSVEDYQQSEHSSHSQHQYPLTEASRNSNDNQSIPSKLGKFFR